MARSRKDAEKEVKGWGFKHVFTWSDGPYESLNKQLALKLTHSLQ